MIFKITSCVVSPNVIRMIRSEMMTSTWHEALMGDKRNALRVPSINFKETDYLEYLGIDGRIILLLSYNRHEKFPGARLLWRIDFVWWLYLWIPSTTVVSYHRSGTQSFVVALDF